MIERSTPLLLVRLSREDIERFHAAHIPYSGAASQVEGYEPYGPYIATLMDELPRCIEALRWNRVELRYQLGQMMALHLL